MIGHGNTDNNLESLCITQTFVRRDSGNQDCEQNMKQEYQLGTKILGMKQVLFSLNILFLFLLHNIFYYTTVLVTLCKSAIWTNIIAFLLITIFRRVIISQACNKAHTSEALLATFNPVDGCDVFLRNIG
jgi:hypothetical protein